MTGPALIVRGPPGSGKSTHAARLADRLGAVHLDLGSRFRELAEEDSALGREVRAAIAEGELLPDALAERVVREQLEAVPPDQGVVLDGYPRNAAQADALRRLLGELGRLRPRPLAVRLDAPRDELVRRLTRRRDVEGRPDDTGAAIAHRLELDEAREPSLTDALGAWADGVRVDASQPADAVTEQILERLGRWR